MRVKATFVVALRFVFQDQTVRSGSGTSERAGEQLYMSLINMAKREINCKIVYYGIGLCGKTTNLHYIHKAVNPTDVGKMVSIDTETERTLYFDLLPLHLGKVYGYQLPSHFNPLPAQVPYHQTRI